MTQARRSPDYALDVSAAPEAAAVLYDTLAGEWGSFAHLLATDRWCDVHDELPPGWQFNDRMPTASQ